MNANAIAGRLLADTHLRTAAAVFFEAARAKGIKAAPIKGLVVSALLYEDPLERPFGDVDVLVAPGDVERLVAIARRRGWPVVRDSKQLGTANIVVPPGIAIDVRSSIGPPAFAALTAERALARSRDVLDRRIAPAQVRLLSGHDHLLVLVVDALMDKLTVKRETRGSDLVRAAAQWMETPESFARDAHEGGLSVAAATVFGWVHEVTDDPRSEAIVRALLPLPAFAGWAARLLEASIKQNPFGPIARLGVRAFADSPLRGAASLALGAIGTARFYLLNGRRSPWEGVLWQPGAALVRPDGP